MCIVQVVECKVIYVIPIHLHPIVTLNLCGPLANYSKVAYVPIDKNVHKESLHSGMRCIVISYICPYSCQLSEAIRCIGDRELVHAHE